jgi:hypothetical protein
MATSWYVLPSGELRTLTRTQDLLVELVPVVEDLCAACEQLRCVIAESEQTRQEARRLIVRARRQRLALQVVTNRDLTAQSKTK